MKTKTLKLLVLSFLFPAFLFAQDNCFEIWRTSKMSLCPQLVSTIEGYTAQPIDKSDFNRYGSYYKLRTDSTGFFYVKKIDSRWWLIDPDGYAGINMAVTSTIGMPSDQKMNAHLMLKDIGFNGIGNFVSPEKQTKDDYNAHVFEKMSYTRRSDSGGFFQRFRTYRKNVLKRSFLSTSTKGLDDIVTIFDSEFSTLCDTYAKEFRLYKDERELLGYFSDNEIYFGVNQLQLFITELPEDDPNYIYAAAYAAEKNIKIETIKKSYSSIAVALKNEFSGRIAEHYFKTVSEAIKKYDPNHLYLGSRLHGTIRAIPHVVKASAQYCDVVSVNFYDRTTPSAEITKSTMWGSWLKEFDKPAIVTEFYTKGINSEYSVQPGAGYYVNNQTDRGYFYQNTCMELLDSKFYIGWQYFRWQDDYKPTATQNEKFSNKGIVDVDMNEYVDMTASMRELNSQVYKIIEHMDGKIVPLPELETTTVNASEATYVSFADENANFGSEQVLKVKNAETESVLKFNIPVKPSEICEATIKLYVTASNAQAGKLLATAVSDQSWTESTLTASAFAANDAWTKVMGRLQTYEKALEQGSFVEYNVRNWLVFNATKGENVTFKLSDVSENLQLEFASDNYSDESKRPQLVLKTFKDAGIGIENQSALALDITLKGSELSIEGVKESVTINIYNMSGISVLNQVITSDSKINLTVGAGLYIVKASGNNVNQSFKIVIK